MGYYANGDGSVTFNRVLDEKEISILEKAQHLCLKVHLLICGQMINTTKMKSGICWKQ